MNQPSKLEEAKKRLEERGIQPIEYKHLGYYEILNLAGVRQ